jgi:hypothetical protein
MSRLEPSRELTWERLPRRGSAGQGSDANAKRRGSSISARDRANRVRGHGFTMMGASDGGYPHRERARPIAPIRNPSKRLWLRQLLVAPPRMERSYQRRSARIAQRQPPAHTQPMQLLAELAPSCQTERALASSTLSHSHQLRRFASRLTRIGCANAPNVSDKRTRCFSFWKHAFTVGEVPFVPAMLAAARPFDVRVTAGRRHLRAPGDAARTGRGHSTISLTTEPS